MKSSTKPRRGIPLSLLTLALLAAPWARADEATSWYLGGSVGPTQATIDDARILQKLGTAGFPGATIADDSLDTGYKLLGGYRFNRYFALEGSYFDLGSYSFSASTTPPGTLNGSIRLRGLGLDAVLIAPLGDKFSVFGKLGANYSEARDAFSSSGAVIVGDSNPSAMELNPKIGIGMQYAFTPAVALRAELERYRINDAVGSRGDVDHLSIGLVYSWGHTPQPMPAPVPVAEPVQVVEVQPVVVVVMEPPPPPPAPKAVILVPTKVTLSADSLFAFDKAAVSPDGKQQLDKFAENLKTLNYEFVTVTGHTDRIGEHRYNMKLSTRRADVVAAYLIQVGGIPESKVLARGQNGSDPVTKPDDCIGTKATKALIACLQPDRRVDLDVTGTR